MTTERERKTESGLALYHPIVSFGYFVAVIAGTLLFIHPVYGFISLISAVVFSGVVNGAKALKSTLLFGIPLFLMISLVNPLFNHHGATCLFYLRDNPITLEAVIYGAVGGVMMFAAIVWFTCYNTVVTSDKFLYVFGRLLPSVALVVSMTLSLIPRLLSQVKIIADTQRTLGLGWKSGSVSHRIHSGARILSILVSWALEDAVTTADSMKARGYGQHKRSSFSIFRFGKRDLKMLILIIALFTFEIFTYASGRGTLTYYPVVVWKMPEPVDLLLFAAFTALGVLPTAIQMKEDRKWKPLK